MKNTEKIKVLVVEPFKAPIVKEIVPSFKAMEKIVRGQLEFIYPFEEDVSLVCNDERKFSGLSPNRALRSKSGEIYDIVFGTFFLLSDPIKDNEENEVDFDDISNAGENENFHSLSEEDILHFTKFFSKPELIIPNNGKFKVLEPK